MPRHPDPARRYLPRPPGVVTEGPALPPGGDALAVAHAAARWCRTLPQVRKAKVWRAGAFKLPDDPRGPPGLDGAVRVYLGWFGALQFNPTYGPTRLRPDARSFIVVRPGPLSLVHVEPPGDWGVEEREASVAAIRTWVARNGGAP